MQTMLYLDIDPTVLADLLHALSMQGEVLAIHAGQDALAIGSATGIADEAMIRTHLTAHGLTPRQCDLVVLDLQGHSRADIAELCGISTATVKKYWAVIYRHLGVKSRPMLRGWVRAQLGDAPAPPLQKQTAVVGTSIRDNGTSHLSQQTLVSGQRLSQKKDQPHSLPQSLRESTSGTPAR